MGVIYHNKGRYYTLKGKYKNEFGEWTDYERTSKDYQFKKKSDAQEVDKKLRKELSKISKSKLGNGMTFSEVSEIFLNHMKTQRKASTVETDVKTLRIVDELNNMQINMIKSDTIQSLLNKMDIDGYSLSYINKLYTTVGKIFKFALKEGAITENPMDKVIKITRPNEVKDDQLKFWTPKEFEIFIGNVDDIQYYTIFNFLYHTGCRKGEALAMNWKDIDFHKKTFHINKTCTQSIKGVPYLITPPKTPNSNRTKRMSDKLTKIMKAWYDHQSQLYGFNDNCFVFGALDKPLPTSNLERGFKRYRNLASGWVCADQIKKSKERESDNLVIGDIVCIEDGNIRNNSEGQKTIHKYFKEVIIDSVADDPQAPYPYHVKLPIKDIPIHGFRHSHATLLINNISNGANIKAIADRLGDTVEQLLKTYAHLFHETEDELIDIIEKNT